VAIGAAWWLWSPDHTPRALAIVSIAAYLVVTPAHELLGSLLRQMASRLRISGPRDLTYEWLSWRPVARDTYETAGRFSTPHPKG
jgi:hypothetical protein